MNRSKFVECLNVYMPKKDAINLEKGVYVHYNENVSLYKQVLYQATYALASGEQTVDDIVKCVNSNLFIFDFPTMEKYKQEQEQFDDYLINPFEVVGGLVKCVNCHSENTLSYSKQDRKADEALSVYCQCIDCKYKWRENN